MIMLSSFPKEAAERFDEFWDRVDIQGSDDCWEWKKSKVRGYGSVRLKGLPVRAHRAAYLLTYGNIPTDKQVLHHCDNPACCNPKHLYIGTQQDNMNDMYRRKRGHWPKREKQPKKRIIPSDPMLANWPYVPSSDLAALVDFK